MIDLVVVGIVAFDDVATPAGSVKRALGGPGSYSSVAASIFCKAGLVAVAGSDFPEEYRAVIGGKGVDLAGLQTVEEKTFYWKGSYEGDMNEAKTHETQLNSMLKFRPVVPREYSDAGHILLTNMDPELQRAVMERTDAVVAMDTMNYWIESKRGELERAIGMADILFVNDAESMQLTGTNCLTEAGEALLAMGPEQVVIKRGAHGSMLFEKGRALSFGVYPIKVVDPTGCGDSFAGTVMGCLAAGKPIEEAMLYGSAVASFNAEDFSLNRLRNITLNEVDERRKSIQVF